MKALLFIRALLKMNFFNWDGMVDRKSVEVVMRNVHEHENFNVGDRYVVTSINRTTGKIGLHAD